MCTANSFRSIRLIYRYRSNSLIRVQLTATMTLPVSFSSTVYDLFIFLFTTKVILHTIYVQRPSLLFPTLLLRFTVRTMHVLPPYVWTTIKLVLVVSCLVTKADFRWFHEWACFSVVLLFFFRKPHDHLKLKIMNVQKRLSCPLLHSAVINIFYSV